jgi:hypothetical protein
VESGELVRFEKGSLYTRAQIRAALGGSPRAALVTQGGRLVCACLTRGKNPRAPEEIVIGDGEGAVRLARAFAASGAAVPVFVRARRGGWEYAGERRVRSLIEEPDASLALLLEEPPREPADAPFAGAPPTVTDARGGAMAAPVALGSEG